MKTLILVRHAKSSWAEPAMEDFDRPLNNRGKKDAPFMAERFANKDLNSELIISSPALRARTTAEIFKEIINYDKEIDFQEGIYHSGSNFFRNAIKEYSNDLNIIMGFGHNPDFTYLVKFFTGENISNVPTCGMIGIRFDIDSWKDIEKKNGEILFFDYPKNPED